MKHFTRARAPLAAVLTALAVILSAVPASAADTDKYSDPIVYSEKKTVLKGTPFDATFDFAQYSSGSAPDKIVITASSTNSSIALGKKTFTYVDTNTEGLMLYPDYTHAPEAFDTEFSGYEIETDDYFFYRLTIPEKYLKRIGDGPGTLKFSISYYEESGGTYSKLYNTVTAEKTVFDPTGTSSGSTDGARLSVANFGLDHSPVKEGEKFRLTFTVRNDGSAACRNASAVLDCSGAAGIGIDGVTDTKSLGTLEPGAEATLSYPMTCLPKMETGNYALTVKLSADEAPDAAPKIYLPVTGTKTSEEDTGSVGDSKPQIIIESYDYGGTAVTGGKEFTLAMNVRNTGAVQIENVKMTVSSESGASDSDKAVTGGAFTPAKSSNTFFIPSLKAGGTVREQIDLLPLADAAPQSYGVSVAFKYEAVVDGKRQSLDAQETIAIPLTQPDRFEVNDAVLQDPLFLGEPGQLTVNYVNKGKSKVFNLSVKLEGNFTTGDGNTYIGNLDSGTGDSFQATLNPSAEGTLQGKATFSYEDAGGTTKTVVKEFTGEVVSAQDMGADLPSKDLPVEGKPSSPPWRIWVISGSALLAAGVLAFLIVFLKKRKAKKLRLLEETDDYDDAPGGGAAK